ncbi:MAG: hypothetical protein AMXMBFR34_06760 [Myxococcaceae bacterium]
MRWALVALLLASGACKREAPKVDAGGAVVVRDAPAPRAAPGVNRAVLDELRDGGWRLAWNSERSGQPQVVVDGAPLTGGPAAHYLGAVLPDGAGVIATASEGGLEELRLVRLDGGVRALGEASLRARHPTVSADGQSVIYESGAGSLSKLSRVELSDGGTSVVLDEPTGCFEPALAPEGTWLAYVSSGDGDSEVYRVDLDAGRRQRLTAFHLEDFRPRVSPDGKWIAFLSNREGRDRLFLVRPDGRGQRRLHEGVPPAGAWDAGAVEAGEQDAVWTPDSRRLVFAARSEGGFWHLASAEAASGRATLLAAGPWDDHQPQVSADGRFLAFVSTRSGTPEVWLARPDGGVTRVSDDAAPDWQPMFLRAR